MRMLGHQLIGFLFCCVIQNVNRDVIHQWKKLDLFRRRQVCQLLFNSLNKGREVTVGQTKSYHQTKLILWNINMHSGLVGIPVWLWRSNLKYKRVHWMKMILKLVNDYKYECENWKDNDLLVFFTTYFITFKSIMSHMSLTFEDVTSAVRCTKSQQTPFSNIAALKKTDYLMC